MDPGYHRIFESDWAVWREIWENLFETRTKGLRKMDRRTTENIELTCLLEKHNSIKHYPLHKQIRMMEHYNATKRQFMDEMDLALDERRYEFALSHAEARRSLRLNYLRNRVLDHYDEDLISRGLRPSKSEVRRKLMRRE